VITFRSGLARLVRMKTGRGSPAGVAPASLSSPRRRRTEVEKIRGCRYLRLTDAAFKQPGGHPESRIPSTGTFPTCDSVAVGVRRNAN
jgi:hypothetical protein